MDFHVIKKAVAEQFAKMSKHTLFKVDVLSHPDTPKFKEDTEHFEHARNALWSTYLGAFRPEDNKIYRERSEHDCSCCKNFIRNIGGVVAIVDGKRMSVWDIDVSDKEPGYQVVIEAMRKMVDKCLVQDHFLHSEKTVGQDRTHEEVWVNGKSSRSTAKVWEHFYVNLPASVVLDKDSIPSKLAELRESKNVLLRGLKELTLESVDTVLEIIAQGSLYRGAEYAVSLKAFKKLQAQFAKLKTNASKDNFAWSQAHQVHGSVARIRNTAIGTLLIDLSEGKDLEDAVKKFETSIMAPSNYKRPTALVTPAMVAKAKEEIENLGLTSALTRRFATLEDVSVNDVLFANRNARKVMKDSIFDDIATTSRSAKTLDRVPEISIDKFLKDVLPTAESLEVFFENKHTANLVSLIAPTDPTAGRLFKWDNDFSWAYNGDVADSDLRSAVKARGGRVDGVFRFSHTWNYGKRNASLMDLHVFHPNSGIKAGNGTNDLYGNQSRVGWNNRNHGPTGGVQDVDYTAEAPQGYEPVENITYPDIAKMPEGTYTCKIHNWQLRSPTQGGFKAEIEFGGNVYAYEYDKPMGNKEWVTVAEVTLKNGVFTIKHHLPEASSSKKMWGLDTQQFHKVNLVTLSPNFWNDQKIGNKHYMFMLSDCVNDGVARGFFNEFLLTELDKHRKVMELVGSKVKTQKNDHQLSGLGFSSTQNNALICRVTGASTRTLKVVF